jgi:hypothetical protein
MDKPARFEQIEFPDPFINRCALFFWTAKSKLPPRMQSGGKTVNLWYPINPLPMSDIINGWLDDEHGVRKLGEMPRTLD